MNTCFLIQKHAECTELIFTFASLPTDSLLHRGDFLLPQCPLVFISVINMRVMIQSSDVSSWLPSWHLLFVHGKLISDSKIVGSARKFKFWYHLLTHIVPNLYDFISSLENTRRFLAECPHCFFPSWPGGQVLKYTISTRKPNNNTVKVVQTTDLFLKE